MRIPQVRHAELGKISGHGVHKKLAIFQLDREPMEISTDQAHGFNVVIQGAVAAIAATFVRFAVNTVTLIPLAHAVGAIQGSKRPMRVGQYLVLNTYAGQGVGAVVMQPGQ